MNSAPTSSLTTRVVDAIRSVTGPGPVALHEPTFQGREWEYVKDCLDSTFVSSVGRYVDEFEEKLAEFTGAARAVAVVNGTSALHVALELAGVGVGDEVLVPALSFAATANAVTYCGAVPHFIDSAESTLGLDPVALRDHLVTIGEMSNGGLVNRSTGRPIRAVVPMHTFGHPVEMDGLLAVASDFALSVVEDAAESLGSYYGDRHTGRFGRLGVFSFNGNKTITTGGGGAIITDDPELAARAKHLTTTAKRPHRWDFWHDERGYNYRLPNLNAALGCAQLDQLPEFLRAKRDLYDGYAQAFAGIDSMEVIREPAGSRSNYWLQTLRLSEADTAVRNAILEATNEAGLMTRPVWSLLPRLPHFRSCPRMKLPVAESLEARLISIPSSPGLRLRSSSEPPGLKPDAAFPQRWLALRSTHKTHHETPRCPTTLRQVRPARNVRNHRVRTGRRLQHLSERRTQAGRH